MTHTVSADRELRAAARHLGRRRFLTVTGAAAALAFGTNLPNTAHAAPALDPRRIGKDPFTLGVASGDPLPDSVVLWTRLAPEPYQADSGLPAEPVTVTWELARDKKFRRSVRSGEVTAHPEFHHSVHVEPDGLEPRRRYYYRFRVGEWTSPVGRTRTAPADGDQPGSVRFAAVSCQAYHHGYFTALKHLAAEEDVDVVFHLGDYLYEYAVDSAGGERKYTGTVLPDHFNKETETLEEYRLRYSLYHADPDLQAAHAAHPWIVTWDDHETENNYADDTPESGGPAEDFLIRRAAAYRAFYENLPLRLPQRPEGPDLQLYRRLRYGRLAQFDVLDTRQYRDNQANGDGWKVPTPESEDADRTLTGTSQERWLTEGWQKSDALWKVVPQQVVFSRRRNRTEGPYPLSMDAWDGYPASRQRVLDGARAAGVENLVVLTGDVHVHYAMDIKDDFDDPGSRTRGVEIVTTSVTSGKDGAEHPGNWEQMRAANAHMKFYDGRRGYVLVTLDEQRLRADYRVVSKVTTPGGTVSTAASFVSLAGDAGLKPA
ncbi:alkaline phosphatase D family protein [Streptomyces sp. N2-109]|uniref:Alkaline phosphatase D family protein n=1 Tax=Streptomyces gossypii TaxID=2883101 RepID=A0ABT2JQI5_9ACTN|nr:alkaline phosphatase D family protein [Streptomyces gossypii]MCT2590152.1 alkaline phosphatase D family protein [Streptomyces gossypii]